MEINYLTHSHSPSSCTDNGADEAAVCDLLCAIYMRNAINIIKVIIVSRRFQALMTAD